MMKKFHFRKSTSSLVNILLRNYLLSYILMTLLFFIGFFVVLIFFMGIYFDIENSDKLEKIQMDIIKDYTSISEKELNALGIFVEVVDQNNNVIYRKGKTTRKNMQYTIEDFSRLTSPLEDRIEDLPKKLKESILLNSETIHREQDGIYMYYTHYKPDKKQLIIVGILERDLNKLTMKQTRISPKYFILIALIAWIIILILVTVLFAKLSSSTFIKPLKILMSGINRFAKGDYEARIQLKSNNEFGKLKDALNNMAESIETERRLKEAAENMRQQFILDISHDLKNPLSSTMGYSEYIMKNDELSEKERKKYLDIIYSNSIRANHLITDLFELAKFESEEYSLQLANVDICECMREIIASYIPELTEKGFEYSFDIPEESVYMEIDKNQFERAIGNLIANGIKYNPTCTVFNICGNKKDHVFQIIVEDQGIGIPKNLQETIFHPFVRVDESRNMKSGGTGLGLAITKAIIEKHGGEIYLCKGNSNGCRFVITLPIK